MKEDSVPPSSVLKCSPCGKWIILVKYIHPTLGNFQVYEFEELKRVKSTALLSCEKVIDSCFICTCQQEFHTYGTFWMAEFFPLTISNRLLVVLFVPLEIGWLHTPARCAVKVWKPRIERTCNNSNGQMKGILTFETYSDWSNNFCLSTSGLIAVWTKNQKYVFIL